MSRSWQRWWLSAVGLMVVACTDSFEPILPAVRLAFTKQPSSAMAGVAIDPVVAVAIEDASGDLVPGATHVVTVAIVGRLDGWDSRRITPGFAPAWSPLMHARAATNRDTRLGAGPMSRRSLASLIVAVLREA